MKNQYTRQLRDCPEILECLEGYLRIKGLIKEYAEKSEYYCFKYKFPIERVIFDGKDDFTVEEKQLYLLNQAAYRLYQYSGDSRYLFDHDNPILRLSYSDNACSPDKRGGRHHDTRAAAPEGYQCAECRDF